MAEKRRYELKKRATRLEDTRRRIVEATSELHRTIGPAATQVSQIARRAGVQRMTVYNHFPDDASLIAACSAHWLALHPRPDPAVWRTILVPGERLRGALGQLYAWYRETEPMTANILRDGEIVPALRPVLQHGFVDYLDQAQRVLTQGFSASGHRQERLRAAARGVLEFHFWRALAPLGDDEAAELAAGFVEHAANAQAGRSPAAGEG